MRVYEYRPFDKPEAVALSMANALILFARTVAESDPLLAVSALQKIRGKLADMLAGLNVSRSDSDRVSVLLDETEAMLTAVGTRH
jgi:hypothetical protein